MLHRNSVRPLVLASAAAAILVWGGLPLTAASPAATAPVIVDYSFSAPVVAHRADGTDRVMMHGLKRWGSPGAPVLPYRTCFILLPAGTEASDVAVVESGWVTVRGAYQVEPGQRPIPLSYRGLVVPTPPDPAVYSSLQPFPAQPWGRPCVQRWRGHTIAIVNLFPVRYLPAAGMLQWCSRLQVRVKLRPRTAAEFAAGLPASRAAADQAYLRRHVDNAESLSSYALVPAAGDGASALLDPDPAYDYVIITNEALAGAGGAYTFQDLLDQKQAQGINATLVTTEWIYANYSGTRPDGGSDNQTRIRNFIADAYATWSTHYVLLGGDGDGAAVGGESGTAVIPHRGFLVDTGYYYDEDVPADMYYGCLDGTFDYSADGEYGEPTDGPGGSEVDLLAEVHIGRAAVDSAAEVSNFVAKTLAYAATMHPRDVWMLGEYSGFGGVSNWGGNYKDQIKDGSSDDGYTTVGFLDSPCSTAYDVYTLYDRDDPENDWPASQLVSIINGGVHLINHVGHAYVDYVMKLYNTDVDALTNTDYFIGYSQGCYNGAFDNRDDWGYYGTADCICEHLTCTAHGAAAFIGNSRYGWGSADSLDSPSQRFDREFWDAVLGEAIPGIGAANDDSKWDNAGYVGADPYGRWACYELNLFGDPQLPIKVVPSQGQVSLDRNAYRIPDTAQITVVDADLDTNPEAPDVATVDIASTTETTPEIVTCTETGPSTMTFAGSIALVGGAPTADGQLQVADGDTITVTYHDADAGSGSPADVTDQAIVDIAAPVISNVQAISITDTSAVITWSTDEDSDSVVHYGESTPPGSTASSATLTCDHAVALNGLTELTTYYFSVVSTDEAGNVATDDNTGSYYSFTTLESPQLMYSFPMNVNPGWSCQSGWQFGRPTGKGTYCTDPTSGHTGLNVYGYNLNGDYPNNMPARYLTTQAIDCRNLAAVRLHFWRWLGVEDAWWDHAGVEASGDGTTWATLWEHTGGTICDGAWVHQEFDISSIADGRQTLYVRWRMGPSDSSIVYPGWNIDDVEIWGVLLTTFLDVPTQYWAYQHIEAIYREGITGGCAVAPRRYCPLGDVTRGQMAVFLCRAAGQTWLDPGSATFADVPRGTNGVWDGGGSGVLDADGTHMFYGWIERLADPSSWPNNTPPTGGCAVSPRRFCPDGVTTRGQMAVFLCRANGKTQLNSATATFGDVPRGADGVATPPFTDGLDADGTHWAYGWIERLADPGSWTTPPTTGCAPGPPRLFCDGDNCRRDQMAVFLCRAFDIPY